MTEAAEEAESPPRPAILHVDMDAFYAAVEIHDDPALAGRPLIVGGAGSRGVVASCNYEARAYGVRSAMSSVVARRLCPHATFLPGRHGRYQEISEQLHLIFREFTPVVEGIALDEAFLDVAGAERLFGSAVEIAHALRRRVASETGLTCSVGVARIKFLAKLASEAAKPHATLRGVEAGPGVIVLDPAEELAFLHPLPIESLWGVGPATAARLGRLGVTTIGQLAVVPLATLETTLGRAHGRALHELSWARDNRRVEPDRVVKSISHEETYAVDRRDRSELDAEVVRMADSVAGRARRAGLVGRTVTVKVRYGDFTTMTRSHTHTTGIDNGPAIASRAGALLDAVDLSPGVRLLGVGLTNLLPASEQDAEQLALNLDGAVAAGDWGRASEAIDAVRRRFGNTAVGPASLAGDGDLRVKRPGDTQWGPAGPESSRS
jgi:DNA polymerase-4